ncbi:MAG: DMT family transporter [Bacteroidales bacterium]|nr:DMT family transporter [Bacteroidales bacterium]MBK9358112.1 DMT family transporter [Bacteroidales bacterium]
MTRSKPWLPWLILIILAVTWGSSFILIKRGLEVFSAGEVGSLRVVITWLFLLPFAMKRIRGLSRHQWLLFLAVGLVGSLIPAFLFAAAQKGIDSSLAGILNSLTPLFTMLVGMSFFKSKPRWFNIAGVVIGLLGAMGLVSVSGSGNFTFNMGYAILIIIAAICYAVNVNVVKTFLQGVDPVTITAMAFFTVGPIASSYLLIFTGFVPAISTHPEALAGLGYITILAIAGTGLALMLFNKLIQMTSAVFSSSVTYFIPVVAVLWGIADGEHFRAGFLLWILLVISGVLLVNTKSLTDNRVYRFFFGKLTN